MKKDKKSFAQRAKEITAKYKKRLGENFERTDKWAVEAMNRELELLAAEQEAQKSLMAQDVAPMMAYGGGLPLYWGDPTKTSRLPYDYMYNQPSELQGAYMGHRQSVYDPTGMTYSAKYRATDPMTNEVPYDTAAIGTPGFPTKSKSKAKAPIKPTTPGVNRLPQRNNYSNAPAIAAPQPVTQSRAKTSTVNPLAPRDAGLNVPIPTITAEEMKAQPQIQYQGTKSGTPEKGPVNWEPYVGMAAQGLGALATAFLTKKPENVELAPSSMPDYIPVDYSEAIRQANLGYADTQAGLRSMGPSAYLAGMSKLAADRARANASVVQAESNENARGRNQRNVEKANFEQRENFQRAGIDEINARNRMWYNEQIAGIPSDIAGVVAGGMRDLTGMKMQDKNIEAMRTQNYGWDPKTSNRIFYGPDGAAFYYDKSGKPVKINRYGGYL